MPKPMRVLHVITTINRGGAENQLIDLIKGQLQSGYTVAVAYLKGNHYWQSTLESLGVEIFPLELRYYGQIRPIVRLRSCLKNFRPHLVHAHMPPAELYAALALLGSGKKTPLVISKHNDERFYNGLFQRKLGRFVALRAAHIITISSAVAQFVRNELRIPEATITTVHYGIAVENYTAVQPEAVTKLRDSFCIPHDTYVIGTIARLTPQKDLPTLLRAYAQYRADTQHPSCLMVVGTGNLEAELRALAVALKIDDHMIWAGFREDIPVIMHAIDCFVLTSIYEGFGLVLLEAMAASRPVVATRVSAIPEVVEHDVTGILCPVGQTNAIADALQRIENKDIRVRMGHAGHDRAKTLFTIEHMVQKTDEVYRRAYTGSKSFCSASHD